MTSLLVTPVLFDVSQYLDAILFLMGFLGWFIGVGVVIKMYVDHVKRALKRKKR